MLPENIVQLALKSRKKGLTAKEREVLDQWLLENVELQEEFHQLVECGSVVQAARLFEDIQIRDAWQNVEQKLSSRPGWKKRHLTIYWSVAATVVIMLTAGWFLFRQSPVRTESEKVVQITPGSLKAVWVLEGGEKYELSENLGRDITNSGGATIGKDSLNTLVIQGGNSGQRSTVRVPEGGEYRVVLSDGTKVWINSGSELTFPMNFEKGERVVELKGEAYFDVAKEAERPFVVCVTGVDVTALGTEFNIAAVQGGDEVLTTLVNGSVRVVNEEGADCILTPAEQAVCKKGVVGIEVQKVNTNLYTSWKDGYYAFDKQPLGEIMRTLERWYDIHVVFADSVAGKLRFSGRLKRYEDIDNLLTMIKLTNDVDFEIAERVIIVRTNKNRK